MGLSAILVTAVLGLLPLFQGDPGPRLPLPDLEPSRVLRHTLFLDNHLNP